MYYNNIPADLQRDARILRRRPRSIREGEVHEVGKMYWSGYWRDWYEVISDGFECNGVLRYVVCRWRNGRTVKHMTPLSSMDWELIPV